MRKVKGFTLIELLIVVAIIAILAAIAVPNFLEAQVRSKVSRVRSDQRSLATAIEAYYVDNNEYPAVRTGAQSVHGGVIGGAQDVMTFAIRILPSTQVLSTLTTPIAYITSYPRDPFANAPQTFEYYKDTNGWILGSYGPNTDQNVSGGGDLHWSPTGGGVETVYTSQQSQPSLTLLTGTGPNGTSYTYDPTNGTVSDGDVWRVKQ